MVSFDSIEAVIAMPVGHRKTLGSILCHSVAKLSGSYCVQVLGMSLIGLLLVGRCLRLFIRWVRFCARPKRLNPYRDCFIYPMDMCQ